MANDIALGAFAESAKARRRLDIAAQATGLAERQLDFQQRKALLDEVRERQKDTRARMSEILGIATQAKAAGTDPQEIRSRLRKHILALGQSVPGLETDTKMMLQRFDSVVALTPTPEQTAATQGRAAGISEVSSAQARVQAVSDTPEERERNLARALGLEQKPPDTKAVFNIETRRPQFATNEEILANRNLVPMESMEALQPEEDITASQRLAAGFAARVSQAHQVINEVGEQFTGFSSRVGELAPQGLKTDERQRFEQAQRNFINAVLRRESGAAIPPSEFESAAQQYFPRPGDGPEVVEQKKQNRLAVVEALKLEAGPAFAQLQARLPSTVTINGKSVQVGTIVTNDRGQRGRVEQDGSITILD